MTTYYVSSEIGKSSNVGTSSTAPLASLQAAANLVKPGDTVLIMDGTYTGPVGGDLLDITTSGTAGAPITFAAAPGAHPVLDSTGTWNAINIKASYITIDGLTIKGGADNFTLQQALANASTGNSSLDGNGIAINSSSSVPLPNHIIIQNNTVYNQPGGGIYTEGADYVQILNNTVYNNAHWSVYGNSGISVSTSKNLDTASGPHIVVSGNTAYGNAQMVPTVGNTKATDGEGIILDSNPGYTGQILVQNNTSYNNGGPGIESFLTANAVITGNTVYGNNTQHVQADSNSGIFINGSSNNTVSNNNTTAPSGGSTGPTGPTTPGAPTIDTKISTDSGASATDHITNDTTLTLTGTAVAGSTVKVLDGTTSLGTATVDSSGKWTLTTSALNDGTHSLTATATSSGQTSAASTAMSVTIDTKVNAPVISSSTTAGSGAYLLKGTAEANSTVSVLDGTKELGTVKADASGAWTYTASSLSAGTHSLTAKAVDVAGNASAASTAVSAVVSGSGPSGPTDPTKPGAPTIDAKISTDSGASATDHVTNDTTLTLTGTAVAGSTVKVLDGTTSLGTATVDSSGKWTLTTSALNDGTHNLTATATSGGQTSAASTAMSVTIDTKVNAPVISSSTAAGSSAYLLKGTAEANSTVSVLDGSKELGTVKADASGAWTYTASSLSAGTHSLTAKAVDVAGNASAASTAVSAVVSGSGPSGPTGPTDPTTPAAPTIAKLSNDVTNDATLTLTGTALADSLMKVFDGAKLVGTAKADDNGHWSVTTSALSDGTHKLTATDTDSSGHTSAASSAVSVTVDTHAPAKPTMGVYSQDGSAVGHTTTLDDLMLKGTAEANSTIKVFDGSKQIGTANTDSKGAWNFDTGHLGDGSHSFSATAADAAGNVSAASGAKAVAVDSATSPGDPTGSTGSVSFTDINQHWNHSATITGTADASSQLKIYDGNHAVGSVKVGTDGTWSYTTSNLFCGTHTFTAKEVDSSGHTVATSSGEAVVGSNGSNTLTSTSGNDLLVGKGHSDTFVFAPNFGNDVIKDFAASGRAHDTIQFSHNEFDSFASVLSHASQVGQDVVIKAGNDSLTLKNTKIGSLDNHDFHFA
jgi:parallel beta-helix repeat protein